MYYFVGDYAFLGFAIALSSFNSKNKLMNFKIQNFLRVLTILCIPIFIYFFIPLSIVLIVLNIYYQTKICFNKINFHKKNLIKKIMIDEFQDNNKKNKELLFLISENDGKELLIENKTEAEFFAELENNISAEKLFFVGDEKQSIYKFRGADVSVFNQLKKSLKDNSGSQENVNLNMTNNYRSSVPLLYSFNLMFGNARRKKQIATQEIFATGTMILK